MDLARGIAEFHEDTVEQMLRDVFRPHAVIGREDHRRIVAQLVQQRAERMVDRDVDVLERITGLGRWRRDIPAKPAVMMVPQEMPAAMRLGEDLGEEIPILLGVEMPRQRRLHPHAADQRVAELERLREVDHRIALAGNRMQPECVANLPRQSCARGPEPIGGVMGAPLDCLQPVDAGQDPAMRDIEDAEPPAGVR